MRCFALANETDVVVVDCFRCSEVDLRWFFGWISKQQLVVYNMLYEVAAMYKLSKAYINIYVDCYILTKMLGGVQYSDIKAGHGLKDMQSEVLGWTRNDDELKEYMKTNHLTWEDVEYFDWEVLSTYCALDAEATWLLYEYFVDLLSVHKLWGSTVAEWHREDCVNEGMLQVEALISGVPIDNKALDDYYDECEANSLKAKEEFFKHPKISKYIAEYNQKALISIGESPPNKFLKDGKTVSKSYLSWCDKYEIAKKAEHFNLNSTKQLRWLFYERAGFTPVKFTPKGGPSVDREVQQTALGEPGRLLTKYNRFIGEMKFLTQLTANITNGRIYPSVIYPGTSTGRVVSRSGRK